MLEYEEIQKIYLSIYLSISLNGTSFISKGAIFLVNNRGKIYKGCQSTLVLHLSAFQQDKTAAAYISSFHII